MNTKKATSYGIIPIYKKDNDFFVLIVKNSKGGHWGLPKGTPENDEKPINTAERELFEETGIKEINIKESPVFKENYSFEQSETTYDKTNIFYIGFVNEMIVGANLDEIDEVKWVKIEEVKDFLTYQSAVDVVNQIKQYLNEI